MKFHLFTILCIVILQQVFPVTFQLPADPDAALQMLENKTLDSTIWQKIRPFYSIPLNVPSCDFLVLKRIFPDMLKQLPSKQIISEKYSPWGEEQITQFFADYPQMIEFEPILDFTGKSEWKGIMNFSISHTSIKETGAAHTAFNLMPSSWLTIRGRSDVWDDYARWSDRSILLKPVKSLSLQIGNIDWPDQFGLMSGRFTDNNLNDSRYNNWIYGNALSWNGFSLDYTRYNPSGVYQMHCLLYGHMLNDNRQYALQAGFPFGACQEINTYFAVDKGSKKQNNAYGGITYQFDTKKLDLTLSIGATSKNHHAFPFLTMFKYSYIIGQFNVLLYHYNDTSGLQNSQKLHSMMIPAQDTKFYSTVTSVDIVNKFSFLVLPSAGVRLSSTLVDYQPIYTVIHFMLDNTSECFGWKTLVKVNLSGNQEKYSFGGTVNYMGFKPLDITLDGCVAYHDDQLILECLRAVFCTKLLKNVATTPAFLLKQRYNDSALEVSGELLTVVTLSKGTTSQLRVKYPIDTNNFWKGLQFDCKVSFLF